MPSRSCRFRSALGSVLLLFALVLASRSADAIALATVMVPGSSDGPDDTGFGRVTYDYRIGQYEITNAQYTEFLNAVAASDPNGLWNASMGVASPLNGGIVRLGSPGGFDYRVIPDRGGMPVNFVSFYDVLRFLNWLENGQRTGAQDEKTTEDGAYTLLGENPPEVGLNFGARYFLPIEDEWHKAAYFDPESRTFFSYPTRSDTAPTCSPPSASPNRANCDSVVADLTTAVSYPGSASPSGTFDQSGNVTEWTESALGANRVLRGGGFAAALPPPPARSQTSPTSEERQIGFRVAILVPEPGPTPASGAALLALATARRLAGRRSGTARCGRPHEG